MKLLLSLCLVMILSQRGFGALAPLPTGPYDAIYVFGDSISDTGNSLLYGDSLFFPSGELPYGMTFFKRATGRASDGRLMADFLAEEFGMSYSIPSLALTGLIKANENRFDIISINFAVVGAAALDRSGSSVGTNASLSVQLGWFKQLIPYICPPPRDSKSFFKKSLFLVGEFGVNDYNYPLLYDDKSLDEAQILVPSVVEAITNAVRTLINEGATELVVPGIFPLGCFPVYLTKFESRNKTDYDNPGCLKAYNGLAKNHNSELKFALKAMRSEYPSIRIIYANLYGASMQFINSPKRFGFGKDTLFRACCGGGGKYNFNVLARCGLVNSTVCEDPSAYPNWDGMHFSEAAYRIISTSLFSNFTTPPLVPKPSDPLISGRVPAKANLKIE